MYNLFAAIRAFPFQIFPDGREKIGKLNQYQIKTLYNHGLFDNEVYRKSSVR